MKRLFLSLLIILPLALFSQTSPSVQTDGQPIRGFQSFEDSILIKLPKIRTTYNGTTSLKILVRDSTNDIVYNSLSIAGLQSYFSALFIENTTTEQAGANFNISGSGTVATNLRVNGQISVNAAASGSYGIQIISKDFYMRGSANGGTTRLWDVQSTAGGERAYINANGLLSLGYGTAPSIASSVNFYGYRAVLGNDDGGGLYLTRFNSGNPYAQIQAYQSASTKGTAGMELSTSQAGVERIAVRLEDAGDARFYDDVYLKRSNTQVTAGGVIKNFIADVNNTSTDETDLFTYTTPGSMLSVNGEMYEFSYTGTFNDATATAALQVYFAGTSIANTGALTISGTGAFVVEGYIIRTSSSTARASVTVHTPTATTALYTAETDLTSMVFTNTAILKITGDAGGAGGGSNDITAKLGWIKWVGAPIN